MQLLRKNAQENLIKATEQNEEPTAKDSTVETRPEHSAFDYDALHNSYQKMEIEFQRQTVLIGQLNAAMEEKDFLNTSLNSQVLSYLESNMVIGMYVSRSKSKSTRFNDWRLKSNISNR